MRLCALCLLQGHSCSPAQQFSPLLYITLTIFKQQQHRHQHSTTYWQDKSHRKQTHTQRRVHSNATCGADPCEELLDKRRFLTDPCSAAASKLVCRLDKTIFVLLVKLSLVCSSPPTDFNSVPCAKHACGIRPTTIDWQLTCI